MIKLYKGNLTYHIKDNYVAFRSTHFGLERVVARLNPNALGG